MWGDRCGEVVLAFAGHERRVSPGGGGEFAGDDQEAVVRPGCIPFDKHPDARPAGLLEGGTDLLSSWVMRSRAAPRP